MSSSLSDPTLHLERRRPGPHTRGWDSAHPNPLVGGGERGRGSEGEGEGQ